jgi:hypothetical protein
MPGPKTCQYLFLIIFTYPGEGQKDALPARCGRKGKAGGSPLSLLAIMPWQARCENGLALYCWPNPMVSIFRVAFMAAYCFSNGALSISRGTFPV